MMLVLVTGNILAGASAISNFVRYNKSFFPIEIRLFGKTVFSGPESPEVDARYPTYLLLAVQLFGTLLLVFSTSCMPRADELRYWLYVLLVVLPFNLRYLYRNTTPRDCARHTGRADGMRRCAGCRISQI